jgi:hypothetical protein
VRTAKDPAADNFGPVYLCRTSDEREMKELRDAARATYNRSWSRSLFYELQASDGLVRAEVPHQVMALPTGAAGEQPAAAPRGAAAAAGPQLGDNDGDEEDEGNQEM